LLVIAADMLSVIPNDAKDVHEHILFALKSKDKIIKKMGLQVLLPLILTNVLKIENQFHLIAEGLNDEDKEISAFCYSFFRKYFNTEAKTSLNKIIFRIFCAIRDNNNRRDIMYILLSNFCPLTEHGLLSCTFVNSLHEHVDNDKAFVLSLLTPSKKSLDDLNFLYFNEGKTHTMECNIPATPVQQMCVNDTEFCNFIMAHLSNGKQKLALKPVVEKLTKAINDLIKSNRHEKNTKKQRKVLGNDQVSQQEINQLMVGIRVLNGN